MSNVNLVPASLGRAKLGYIELGSGYVSQLNHAQARAVIRYQAVQVISQAKASIKNTYRAYGQVNAVISGAQKGRPIADISNDGWTGVG